MKHFILLLTGLLSILFVDTICGQVFENESYSKSNRYTQNAVYNNDVQLSLVQRDDNRINLIPVNEEYVDLEINSLYNAKANSYLAILSIIQNGSTASAADSLINARYTGFCNDLRRFEILKDDIFIDMISMVPIFDVQVEKKLFSKTYNEVPVGFKIQKNIHIYYEKPEMLDRILTAASKHEIYDLIKVEYFVNNTKAIYDTLVDLSIDALNKKVNRLKKLGVVLDTLRHVFSDQKNVFFPVDRYTPYYSYGGISLATTEQGGTKSFTKTPTMFYNKLPYHNFDIILNPAFREPEVQYTYNIRLRFYLKAEKKEGQDLKMTQKPENIYYIITPQGEVKKLNTE